jgi:hypothetical protein
MRYKGRFGEKSQMPFKDENLFADLINLGGWIILLTASDSPFERKSSDIRMDTRLG